MKSESWRNGWLAHKAGAPSESNPYDEHTQAISHERWMEGWCGRFNLIKHAYDDVEDKDRECLDEVD